MNSIENPIRICFFCFTPSPSLSIQLNSQSSIVMTVSNVQYCQSNKRQLYLFLSPSPFQLINLSSWFRWTDGEQWRGHPADHHHHPRRRTHWSVPNDGKGVAGVTASVASFLDHLITLTWPPWSFINSSWCALNTLSSLSKRPWSSLQTFFFFFFALLALLIDFLL